MEQRVNRWNGNTLLRRIQADQLFTDKVSRRYETFIKTGVKPDLDDIGDTLAA